jgi:hypothetical protein
VNRIDRVRDYIEIARKNRNNSCETCSRDRKKDQACYHCWNTYFESKEGYWIPEDSFDYIRKRLGKLGELNYPKNQKSYPSLKSILDLERQKLDE